MYKAPRSNQTKPNQTKPSHCNKQGKRYRYYVNSDTSLPAHQIEALVIGEITAFLGNQSSLARILQHEDASELTVMLVQATELAAELKANPSRSGLKSLIGKVVVTPSQIGINLNLNGLRSVTRNKTSGEPSSSALDDKTHIITYSINLKRSGQGKRIILGSDNSKNGKADPVLLKAITQAHIWLDDLKAGKSFKEIGERTNIDQRHLARTIKLAFLAPDIIETIFQGREPQGLTAERLLRLPALPVDWQEQQKLLGFI